MAELKAPLLALLHEGGWDEMLMVAVGLIVAYAVITWTGRRSRDEDQDHEEADQDADDDVQPGRAESAAERPDGRGDDATRG